MTYLLIPRLLPLSNQHSIRVAIFQQPLVQLLADRLLLVVQLVHVSAPLMADLEDLPVCLMSGDVDRCFVLCIFHLIREDEQVVFYVCEAGWRRFALGGVADCWHFCGFFLVAEMARSERHGKAFGVGRSWQVWCCIGTRFFSVAGSFFLSLETLVMSRP